MKSKHRIALIQKNPHNILKTFNLRTALHTKARQYANILSKLNHTAFYELSDWKTRQLGKKIISVRISKTHPNFEVHVIPL